MNKFLIVPVLGVLIICIGLSGCIVGNWVSESGTIIYLDFEGGFYGITVGELCLDPINLPDDFKEDGLSVRFIGRMVPRLYSYHMWGISFYILKIEKLE